MRDTIGKTILKGIGAVLAFLLQGAYLLGCLLGSLIFLAGLGVAAGPYAELLVLPAIAYLFHGQNIFPADYQASLALFALGTIIIIAGATLTGFCHQRWLVHRLHWPKLPRSVAQ